ncbi:hypothetical protein COR50_07250 [Chitinophaga caeni]|uniref:Uncharacterized protein n=1 Tax=Chitinophaga caeni TaxID=2029983 RepID=A0A291QSS2_9BACT|nr:hypothetical protein [Chitinophaga caeni]ATL46996.1 hypothetical protein COR50_07250 [Chitinophaga caeni]
MKNMNIFNAEIPQEKIQSAINKIDEAFNELKPYLITLQPEERQMLPKMGNKMFSFVNKVHELAKRNPDLAPSFFSIEDLEIDVAGAQSLEPLLNAVKQLYDGIDDTRMKCGSEAYTNSLAFYSSVKVASKHSVQKAKAVYDDLSGHFIKGANTESAPAAENKPA